MNVQKKKKLLYFGLGISGLSAALFLKKQSQSIFCWDDDFKKKNECQTKKTKY